MYIVLAPGALVLAQTCETRANLNKSKVKGTDHWRTDTNGSNQVQWYTEQHERIRTGRTRTIFEYFEGSSLRAPGRGPLPIVFYSLSMILLIVFTTEARAVSATVAR